MMDSFWRWFDSTAFWQFIAKQIVGKLNFRLVGYPGFDWSRAKELQDIIERYQKDHALAFVNLDKRSLSSLLIRKFGGSDWQHAGLIIDNFQAAEMKASGLNIHSLCYPMSQCDDFAVVAFPLTPKEMELYRFRIETLIREKRVFAYDYEQDLENDANRLYCSELILKTLHDLVPMAKPDYVLGRFAFSPDSVYLSGTVIFESRSK